jgi:hypothetical protein
MRDDEKALIFWDADILTNNNDLLRVMMKTSLENPKMRVCCGETQEGQILECPKYKLKMNGHKAASINIRRRYLEGKRGKKRRARMRGHPHSNEPEKAMKVELWVGVTQSGWSLRIWIPMKRDPEANEAKGRGLDIKLYQAQ